MENLDYYQTRGDYKIIAYVLMPNHFHLVLRVDSLTTISQCIGNLKRITSRKISDYLNRYRDIKTIRQLKQAAHLKNTKDARIWQYRYDCMIITNEKMLLQKVNYIHNNPVRQKLVENPSNWPFSSALDYSNSNKGNIIIETDWGNLLD